MTASTSSRLEITQGYTTFHFETLNNSVTVRLIKLAPFQVSGLWMRQLSHREARALYDWLGDLSTRRRKLPVGVSLSRVSGRARLSIGLNNSLSGSIEFLPMMNKTRLRIAISSSRTGDLGRVSGTLLADDIAALHHWLGQGLGLEPDARAA